MPAGNSQRRGIGDNRRGLREIVPLTRFRWADAGHTAEGLVEMRGVPEAHTQGNAIDRQVGVAQQVLRVLDAPDQDVTLRRHAEALEKASREIVLRQLHHRRQARYVERRGELVGYKTSANQAAFASHTICPLPSHSTFPRGMNTFQHN